MKVKDMVVGEIYFYMHPRGGYSNGPVMLLSKEPHRKQSEWSSAAVPCEPRRGAGVKVANLKHISAKQMEALYALDDPEARLAFFSMSGMDNDYNAEFSMTSAIRELYRSRYDDRLEGENNRIAAEKAAEERARLAEERRQKQARKLEMHMKGIGEWRGNSLMLEPADIDELLTLLGG